MAISKATSRDAPYHGIKPVALQVSSDRHENYV